MDLQDFMSLKYDQAAFSSFYLKRPCKARTVEAGLLEN